MLKSCGVAGLTALGIFAAFYTGNSVVPGWRALDRPFWITPVSGCHLTSYVFYLETDCSRAGIPATRIRELSAMASGQSIYVPYNALRPFAAALGQLRRKIVVVIGQERFSSLDEFGVKKAISQIVRSRHVDSVFLMNPSLLRHHKVEPWPYGIRWDRRYTSQLESVAVASPRRPRGTQLFLSSIATSGAGRDHRIGIPSGKPLSRRKYFAALADAEYVLSPDGDRPDCYRHYEALILGAVPIVSKRVHWLPGALVLPSYDPAMFTPLRNFTRTLPPYAPPSNAVVLHHHWAQKLRGAECRAGRVGKTCGRGPE